MTHKFRLIRKLMAMPFLPAGEIPAAFAKLRLRASTNGVKRLVSYIGSTWIDSTTFLPKDWSVYGQAIRTNNDGLDRWAGGRVHIPFYLLIQHLHREAKLSALQVRLVSDGKLKRIQRKNLSPPSGQDFWSLGRLRLKGKNRSTVTKGMQPS